MANAMLAQGEGHALISRERESSQQIVALNITVVCKKSSRKKSKILCSTICHYPDYLLGTVGGTLPPRPFSLFTTRGLGE